MTSMTATASETVAAAALDDDALDFEASTLQTPAVGPSAVAVAGEPSPRNLFDLLIILSRRKQLILRITIASAVLATGVAWLLPNRYTATTNILPPQQSQSLAASMIGQLGALGPMAAMAQKDLGLKNSNDLYLGMLRSRTAEDALIRRFDLLRVYRDKRMSDARKDLVKASSIVLGKEGFISISVEDRDRSRATQIANAYVDELRQLTQNLAVTEAGQRRLFFEGQLEAAKNHLADAEQALKATEQKTGLIQPDGQAKAIIEAVVKLRALIAAKEVELRARRLFSTEQNPDTMLGEEQLSGMRAQLALMEKQSGGPGSPAGDAEVSAGNVPVGNVPEAGLQYIRKLRDVKYAETLFELLAKQYEAARLDEAKTAAVIQVVDPALEPDRKSWPPRSLIVALAALFGLFGSCMYGLLAEALQRMRREPESNARLLALRTSITKGGWL
jgi:tyrosine-protein kinase Etk/Wzc